MLFSAFINPKGAISSKRAVGIPVGLVFIFLYTTLIIINLFFGLAVDEFVLDGIDNLGYLCTALLSATIADCNQKPSTKPEKPPKSFFIRLITTCNNTVSSKKFIGVIAGFVFCVLQIIITFCNIFLAKKLSENVFTHSKGLMFLSLVLLGVDVARPSIQKIQSLFTKK